MRDPSRSATLLAVALAAAACAEESSPADRLAAAGAATEAEGTAAFSLEMDVAMGQHGPGAQMTVAGEGVVDLTSDVGRMEMTYPGVGGPLVTIFDGDAVYVRVPAAAAGGEARWIRRDTEQGGAGRLPGAQLGRNPLGILDALGAVEGDVRSVGSDTVAGEAVEGFGFALAGPELWGATGADGGVPPALRDLRIPSEAWLDDGDRVRRLVLELDLADLAEVVRQAAPDSLREGLGGLLGSIGGTLTMTTELREFGVEVDVEPPSEEELMDEEELRGLSDGAGDGEDGADAQRPPSGGRDAEGEDGR